MADQPATKKELAALQKQVDELRKAFEAEKKEVLTNQTKVSKDIAALEWKVDDLHTDVEELKKPKK